MEQLILHLLGDYVTQSDWMAQNKTKASWPAFCHAFIYSLPFLWLAWSAPNAALAMAVILSTHFLIDRFRLARYVVWAKNFIAPYRIYDPEREMRVITNPPWSICTATGYPPDRPAWLAVWLLIVADNTIHLVLNYVALRWL